MDFKDQIKQLGDRVAKMLPQIQTEEATKTSLTLPFIQILGYDIFNPSEVNPEFVADLGIKKGEKVDYAIMKDGEPILLIECKHTIRKNSIRTTRSCFVTFILPRLNLVCSQTDCTIDSIPTWWNPTKWTRNLFLNFCSPRSRKPK